MAKNEKTTKHSAKLASKVLRDKSASKREKAMAGALLTQAPDKKKKR